jgi:hypothetical protein
VKKIVNKATLVFGILVLFVLCGCATTETNQLTRLPSNEPVLSASLQDKKIIEQERQKKLTKTITSVPTPLRVPDTIIRTLILPYIDEKNRLHTWRYVFMKVDEGRWILGEYLIEPIKQKRTFEPLKKIERSMIKKKSRTVKPQILPTPEQQEKQKNPLSYSGQDANEILKSVRNGRCVEGYCPATKQIQGNK